MPIDLNGACASMMLGTKKGYDPSWTVLEAEASAGHLRHGFDGLKPVPGKAVEVDWGDGTVDSSLVHDYATPGTYTIIIKDCTWFLMYAWGEPKIVTRAIQCGDTIKFASYAFSGTALTEVMDTFRFPDRVVDYTNAFPSSLKSLPDGFSISAGAILKGTFLNMGIAVFPDGMFKGPASNVTRTFSKCRNMTRVPSSFEIADTVKEAEETFYACSSLASVNDRFRLPEGMVRAVGIFGRAYAMTSLPAGFQLPDTLEDASYMFDQNYALTSLGGLKIPNGMRNLECFCRNNPELADDISDILPERFAGTGINMYAAFAVNKKLTGTAPAENLWLDTTPGKWKDTRGCFTGCFSLANYKDIPESWGGPYKDPLEDKYLRFTAEQDGSLLRLDKSADAPSLTARLEYKVNSGNWEEYTWGQDEGVTDKKLGHLISLPKAGDCVKWRAVDFNQTFCTGYNKPNYNFTGSGKTSLSGNLASLITHGNPDDQRTIPSPNYFRYLFASSSFISSIDNLVIDFDETLFASLGNVFESSRVFKNAKVKISKSAEALLIRCFAGNLDLQESLVDIVNLFGKRDLEDMFYSCTNLKKIAVTFHRWLSSVTTNWVYNVSPHGVFTCPSDLPVIFGDSNIPHGWTVDNGLTEPSDEEVLNACYLYKNGKLIIQPDFRACLYRAEQIDYVKHGKTYWHKNTPLPNPHRPELGGGYYKVTSLSYLLWDSRIPNFDVSAWDLTEVTNLDHTWGWTMISKTTFDKSKVFSKVTLLNSTFFQIVGGFTNLTLIDLSMFDFANCTVEKMDGAFENCVKVTEAYARTQADCDKLNASSYKPTTWEFVIHPDLLNVPSFTLGNAGEFNGQYKPTGTLTPEGLPIYANENVWNFQMKPTVEEDGRTRFVFFSTQGLGNSYACNTSLDTPIDPTACCGKRQLLRDLTYTGGDGQQYAVTITFDEPKPVS